MAFCAIFNSESHEAEFIEQWDADHTEGILEDWKGTIYEFFAFRCQILASECAGRGYAKWKVYTSSDTPFSWDAVTPKVAEDLTSA